MSVPSGDPTVPPQPWIHQMYYKLGQVAHTAHHIVNDVHPETGEYDPGLMSKLEKAGIAVGIACMIIYGVAIYGAWQDRRTKGE